MTAASSPDLRWLARERFCLDRKSFADIAKELGVAQSTLRDWAKRSNWEEEREEVAEAEAMIRINAVKCRARVLQKLLESENGDDISRMAEAAASLERFTPECASGKTGMDTAQACSLIAGAFAHPSVAAPAMEKRPRRAKAKKAEPGQGVPLLSADCAEAAPGGADAAIQATLKDMDDVDGAERIRLLNRAVNRQLAYVLTCPVDDLSKRVKEIKAAMDILDALQGRETDSALIVSFEE